MTCPDDPALFRKMLTPPNHLEPAVGISHSDVGKLKRTIAMRDAELECYRMMYPGWVFSPKALCLYQRGTYIDFDDDGGEGM